jgi:hypothetical protein
MGNGLGYKIYDFFGEKIGDDGKNNYEKEATDNPLSQLLQMF